LDASALGAMADAMQARANAVLDLLDTVRPTLADATRQQADALLASRSALIARFDRIRELDAAGQLIRIHGDYHLGQVLHAEEDFFILDFEGEPARTLAERRARQSPLKDVAGMVRSYNYAAYAALFTFTVHAPDDLVTLEPWAMLWHYWVTDAFIREYRNTIGTSPIVPPADHDSAFTTLLMALTLEKALYELSYELNNRPEWVRIPLTGLLTMVP
jgi:maltose alpha-D-glucosyltransferase/alpha-amylase